VSNEKIEEFSSKVFDVLDKYSSKGEKKEALNKELQNYMNPILSEIEDLTSRVVWLENAVDEMNIEEIFVEYQKKFDLFFWTGIVK
jgi:hypothetical protein